MVTILSRRREGFRSGLKAEGDNYWWLKFWHLFLLLRLLFSSSSAPPGFLLLFSSSAPFFSGPPPQVSSPLRASGPVGGGPWSLLGGLQHHGGPEVFSSQPLWRHLWPLGAVCSWSWPPRHQHYRLSLSFSVASYPAFTPQCLPIKCQTCVFMVCLSNWTFFREPLNQFIGTVLLTVCLFEHYFISVPLTRDFLLSFDIHSDLSHNDLRYMKHLVTCSSSYSSSFCST